MPGGFGAQVFLFFRATLLIIKRLKGDSMNHFTRPIVLAVVAAIAGVAAHTVATSGHADAEASSIYGVKIPEGYRDWKLISVTHEEGDFNQLRAQVGNDRAIKAYRDGKLPFPDGAVIVALHWKRVPSEEDNKVFGREQAFIAGSLVNIQVMVKDSKKYAATGGLGVRGFCRRQTERRSDAQEVLPLSRAR
jgi:hypothetical protein